MVDFAKQKVSITLTIEEFAFICSGLKDCADRLQVLPADDVVTKADYAVMALENLVLAHRIEAAIANANANVNVPQKGNS